MRLFIILSILFTLSFANIGKVSLAIGDVKAKRDNQEVIVKTGFILEEKDIIQTSKNSKAQLIFSDSTIITIGKNSSLNINEYLYDTKNPKNSKTDFSFFKGAFKTITGKIGKINKKKFKLRTKTASIGIRGTIVLGNQKIIACTKGGITVSSGGVSVDVKANQLTVMQKNGKPSKARKMTSNDLKGLSQSVSTNSSSTDTSSTTNNEQEDNPSSNETDSTNTDGVDSVVSNAQEQSSKSNDEAATSAVQGSEDTINRWHTSLKTKIVAKDSNSLDKYGNIDSATNINNRFLRSKNLINEYLLEESIDEYKRHYQVGKFRSKDSFFTNYYYVQGDNKKEFFVSYDDFGFSKSLIVYGDDTTHTFDTEKIYIYKTFKNFKVSSSSADFVDNEVLHFYNPALNSYTSLSKEFFKSGGNRFVYGNKDSVRVVENSFNLDDSTVDDIYGAGENSFKGSVAQGLTQTIKNSDKDGTVDSNKLSGSFLNSKQDKTTNPNKTMTGKTVFIYSDSSSSASDKGTIKVNISDDGATVDASAKGLDGEDILNFSGNVANIEVKTANNTSAFYINSDLFGAEAVEYVSSDLGLQKVALSAGENGYFIAVPDGGYDSNGKFTIYDEYDNPFVSDDDSSWGYIAAKDSAIVATNTVSINPLSVWVAGVETSTTAIDALINGTSQTLSFNGKVLGFIDNKDAILLDDTNRVKIDFDLGGGTKNMTGNMQFKSANSELFDLNLDITDVTNSEFNGQFKPASTPSAESIGELNGKYYGDGELKSLGGDFEVEQYGKTAKGVFKAVKQ